MKPKKENGFTLAELLVTISIILLLTSFVLANYRKGEESYALQRAAHKLAQDLRKTAEMAIGGREHGGSFPLGGYGIYFSGPGSTYILFADSNGDSIYNSGEAVETLSLQERGVTISAVSPSFSLSITFFPPDPIIKINPDPGSPYEAIITLRQRSQEKRVKINGVGLTEIID